MVGYRWRLGLDAAHVDFWKAQWMWEVTNHSEPQSVFSFLFFFNCLLFLTIMIISIILRSYFIIALREHENSLKLKWKRYCPEYYYVPMLPSAGKIVQYFKK